MAKAALKKVFSLLPAQLQNELAYRKNRYQRKGIVSHWQEQGKPLPPPHQVKQLIIEEYQQKYGCKILVETGTYLGHMVLAQKNNFTQIYSIELSHELWKQAAAKFASYPHIEILQGDSGKVLHDLVPKLDTRTLFWLDGHYSAGITAKGEKVCPIYEELDAIFKGKSLAHILLVDDARLFTGQGGYPTLQALEAYLKSKDSYYQMTVKDDTIRFVRNNL